MDQVQNSESAEDLNEFFNNRVIRLERRADTNKFLKSIKKDFGLNDLSHLIQSISQYIKSSNSFTTGESKSLVKGLSLLVNSIKEPKLNLSSKDQQLLIDILSKINKQIRDQVTPLQQQQYSTLLLSIISKLDSKILQNLFLNSKNIQSLGSLTLILKKQEFYQEIHATLITKIKDSILVDTNIDKTVQDIETLQYYISDIFDQENFEKIIYPGIQRLLKRNEKNLVLVASIMEHVNADFSKFTKEFVQKSLQEFLLPKTPENQEWVSQILKNVFRNTKDINAIQDTLTHLISEVQSNNNEAKRFSLLTYLDATVSSENLDVKAKTRIFISYLQSLLFIQNDDNLNKFKKYFIRLFSNFKVEKIEPNEIMAINKLLSGANTNKIVQSTLLTSLNYMLDQGVNLKEHIQGIFDIVYKQFIDVIFKAPGKLVSMYSIFLPAFAFIGKCLKNKLVDKFDLQIPNHIANLVKADCFLMQKKFYDKADRQDIILFADSLIVFEGTFASKIPENDSSYSTLCFTLAQVFSSVYLDFKVFGPQINNLKNYNKYRKMIIKGIYDRILVTTEYSLSEENTLKNIFHYLAITQLKDFEEIDIFKLLWCLCSPVFNKNKKIYTEFLNKLQKKPEVYQCFKDQFETQNQVQLINQFILSKSGIFSQKQLQRETSYNLLDFLIKMGYDDILNKFVLFFDKDNYTNSAQIEQFEEQQIEQYSFEKDIQIAGSLISNLGFIQLVPGTDNKFEEEKKNQGSNTTKQQQQTSVNAGLLNKKQTKPAPTQTVPQKKGGKQPPITQDSKKGKIEYFEPEELETKRKADLILKMTEYFEAVKDALIPIVRTMPRQTEIKFFDLFFRHMQILLEQRQVRMSVSQILYNYCLCCQIRYIRQGAESLVDTFVKLNSGIDILDREIDTLCKALNHLQKIDYSNIPQHLLKFIFTIVEKLAVCKEVDNQIKNHAVIVIVKLSQAVIPSEYFLKVWLIILPNLNSLIQFEEIPDLLKSLIHKIPANQIQQILDRILQYLPNAEQIVLDSLEVLPNDFTDFTFTQKMFLLILTQDLDSDISQKAQNLLARYQIRFIPEEVQTFDLYTFIKINEIELVDRWIQLTNTNILKDFNKDVWEILVDQVNVTIDKLTEEGAAEENLMFHPEFYEINQKYVSVTNFNSIFTRFIKNCCKEETHMLMQRALDVGIELIKLYGSDAATSLMTLLEKFLDQQNSGDVQTQISSIIYLGVCSPFLKDRKNLKTISSKILKLVDSKSENVQRSLAKCMPELISFFENPEELAKNSLKNLIEIKDPHAQRGSAYLLSGLIKALGVITIEKLNIFKFLDEASIETKKESKDQNIKIGAITLIKTLNEILGKLIEPFILEMLSILKKFFGDNSEDVRINALRTTKYAMQNLSGYGVKQVLPLLLEGINEKQWRAKVANIWALGNMAYCSPKQLSVCLPLIVTKLSETLSDTHPKVKESANESLNLIGSTIKNPEISEVVDILIKALSDPFEQNKKGLDVLLNIKFVHYIDTPSLSLIVPIIEYGLSSRESILKQNAAQIVGTISNLIKDPKSLLPYLNGLLHSLRISICDNISEVRSIASKALGALAKKLGTDYCDVILLDIRQILENKSSTSVERAGAAQAFSEIICGYGKQFLDNIMPQILALTRDQRPHIRESFIGVFVFLPVILQDNFDPYIKSVVDNVIESLADDDESIRNLALRVNKILIQKFGIKRKELLLEPVKEGLLSVSWKKRHSSCVLMTEMMDVLVKEARRKKEAVKPIFEENSSIIALFHILKYDVAEQVRIQANIAWKTFIENTPKELKRLIPELMDILIEIITQDNDLGDIAKACLVAFVPKYADQILKEILQHIQITKDKYGDNLNILNGICLTLNEMARSLSHYHVVDKKETFLSITKDISLRDDPYLRKTAFKVLDALLIKLKDHTNPLELIVPDLITKLQVIDEQSEEYEKYTRILEEIINFNTREVLDYFIPLLFNIPMTNYAIDVITSTANIFGPVIFQYEETEDVFKQVIDYLIINHQSEEKVEALLYCISQLSGFIPAPKVNSFIDDLVDYFRVPDEKQSNKTYYALEVLKHFMQERCQELTESKISELCDQLLVLMSYPDQRVLKTVSLCMRALVNSIPKDEILEFTEKLVNSFERGLSSPLSRKSQYILLFSQENAIDPFLEVAIQSLVFGSKDICTNAVRLYNVMLKYTETEALQQYSLKLIGPVIRVLNYKYDLDIKSRLLQILNKFTEKKISLKPFAIQLQTTLLKLLNEFPESINFIENVSIVLVHVMGLTIKKDLLFNETFVRFLKEINQAGNAYPYGTFIENALKEHHNHISKALIESIARTIVEVDSQIKDGQLAFSYGKILGYFSLVLGDKWAAKIFADFSQAANSPNSENKNKAIMQLVGFIRITEESVFMSREQTIREFICNYILAEDDENKIEDFVDACATYKDTRGSRFAVIKKALGNKKLLDSDKADIITTVEAFHDLA